MRWLVVLVSLTGCSFEPRHGGDAAGPGTADADGDAAGPIDAVDASTTADSDDDGVVDADDNCPDLANANQRDWDSDDHGDVCDGCPHLASTADPDGDGDQVGDACDPHPATPGDARAIWLGFYGPADIAGWVNTGGNGQWSVAGDALVEAANGFSLLDSPTSYTDAYFATRLEVTTANTSEIGFCLADIQPALQYYCCGVSNTGGVPTARAVSAWSTSGGQVAVPASFTGANLAVGQLVDMVGLLEGPTFSCTIQQGAVTATPATPTGGNVGPAVFYTTSPVAYRYVFVVTVP